jgi:signal transduction histidine kinase
MFKSATFQLTLWYLAIIMVICLLFSVSLYNVTTHELHRGIRSESQRIQQNYPIFQDDPMLRPGPDINNSSDRVLKQLIAFNVIVMISAGFASYWLARRTLAPIEEAHEQQKRFTSDVSHELRTPLTAIRMESEVALMNSKSKPAELRDTIASNLEEVGKLEALINNLLRLTSLEADEVQQAFVKLKSKDIVDSAIEKVSGPASNRQIAINSVLANKTVLGDKDSLSQLLVILLDNAIKYSPEKSTVTVRVKAEKDRVIWQVQDQGAGITPEALEHVFDRFYRADSSRNKTQTEGYGLGLSIAKMIADIHHAEITISSRVGHGTTVTISLPLAPTPVKQPPQQ